QRRPAPEDRRGVLVSLTDAGRARVDAAFTDLLEREHTLLSSLDLDERHALAGLLRTMLAPFDTCPALRFPHASALLIAAALCAPAGHRPHPGDSVRPRSASPSHHERSRR